MNAQRLETVRQRDAGSAERAEAAGAVTQARFGACCQRTTTPVLKGTESALQQALCALDALNSLLQQHCGKEAPGLGSIRAVAEEMLAFLAVELADRQKPSLFASLLPKRTPPPADRVPLSPATDAAATPQSPRTREEAYHQLSEIADFLLRTEPHSPTPYLIQCAASWGEMPLPALVQQLSQSGSDISRLLDALGLLNLEEEIDHQDGILQ